MVCAVMSEKKWYSILAKDRKEREKEKGRHTGQKEPTTYGQKSGSDSGAKGGSGYGHKKFGGDDGPAYLNPITVTPTNTAAANTKVCS